VLNKIHLKKFRGVHQWCGEVRVLPPEQQEEAGDWSHNNKSNPGKTEGFWSLLLSGFSYVEPSAVGEILFGSRPPGTISALFG
jgi:hypothetical protein